MKEKLYHWVFDIFQTTEKKFTPETGTIIFYKILMQITKFIYKLNKHKINENNHIELKYSSKTPSTYVYIYI